MKASLDDGGQLVVQATTSDLTDRFLGKFDALTILQITGACGSRKSIDVFWRMLASAINGKTDFVYLSIGNSANDSELQVNLAFKTEFDSIEYPLLLQKAEYTDEELREIISLLLERSNQMDKTVARIGFLDKRTRELESEIQRKDREIAELQSMLSMSLKHRPTSPKKKAHPQNDITGSGE